MKTESVYLFVLFSIFSVCYLFRALTTLWDGDNYKLSQHIYYKRATLYYSTNIIWVIPPVVV